MPHFTLQISQQGAVLNALITVSAPRSSALIQAAQSVPNPVQIRALIDTGASATCVDPTVLKTLNLSPTGNATINTPSTGSQPVMVDQYDVGIIVPAGANQIPLLIPTLPVICAELLIPQGFHGLIGRDILSQCMLIYNGNIQLFTLAY